MLNKVSAVDSAYPDHRQRRMLTIRADQLKSLDDHAWRKFAGDLRPALARKYPHCLPLFPLKVQEQIVLNMLGRARRWGITWQSALTAFAEMMLAVAPNFDALREVRVALRLDWLDQNRAMLSLDRQLIKNDWDAAGIPVNDLPLFVPPERIDSTLLDQTAAALPVVLGDKIGGAGPHSVAGAALSLAGSLGLDTVPDAGLVAAAWRLFYGSRFQDRSAYPWLANVFGEKLAPAESVARLKRRIALDHGRFV